MHGVSFFDTPSVN